MSLARPLYDAHLTIAGHPITWREIVGNAFGFASASAACAAGCGRGRSASSATCCCSRSSSRATFEADAQVPLFGQAGRQVFFIVTSIYGW